MAIDQNEKKKITAFSVLGALIVLLLKAICLLLAIATPVLGVWVSSSLAAYLNGPIWATILVGLLFFPLLPLAWEGFSAWRRSRKEKKMERFLTFWDRLVLRTLFLNFTFLVVLLLARPEAGFTALQARGDWMLEGVEAPWASSVRPHLFKTADGLEWLYVAARENPYAEDNPDDDVVPDGPPGGEGATPGDDDGTGPSGPGTKTNGDAGPSKTDPGGLGGRWGGVDDGSGGTPGTDGTKGAKIPPGTKGGGAVGEPPDGGTRGGRPKSVRVLWPSPATLHPVVAGMPASAETSIKAVAMYIGERETDELGRIRAVHDWVADRIAYDAPALELPRLPPQNAELIFKNRIGVCSGYALLLRAIAKEIDLNVVYVVGDSRDQSGDIAGGGHAWNAVKIDGAWHLIDATWDSGSVNDGRFKKGYNTRYFLAPPEVFGINHFPDRPQWQLRKSPISRGDFIRLPMLDPRFYVNKMRLIEPSRSQITVEDQVIIRVANPNKMFILADFKALGSTASKGTRCQVNHGAEERFVCKFPREGSWRVQMFMNRERYGSFSYAGQILVNSR